MRVRVQFRVDVATGEVQEFLVEDMSTETSEDHDAEHDRIAREVGKVVARRPAPEQVTPGEAGPSQLVYRPDDEDQPREQRPETATE
jgi:hypothetical protein